MPSPTDVGVADNHLCFAGALDPAPPQRRLPQAQRHPLRRRGQVILGGEVVGNFEVAGGALVFHEIDPRSPLIGIFDLRQVQ